MSELQSDAILARMFELHPKVIDLTLDRMIRLLEVMNHPEKRLPPVIHIAGTNGKGSTQAMLRAGFEGAGLSVHAYTSPHLARFHERVRLAGELIPEEVLSAVLDEARALNGSDPITYFEITTAAALLAMSRVPADVTLLEVGLGGRLDATNVVAQPALTIITPVSMDHEGYLGSTLAEIAGEKAGIIKRGVPCIVARQDEAALDVIEARAARLGAPLLVAGQHWHVREERGRLVFEDEYGLADLPLPVLPGAHQIDNAGGVLAGLRHLARSGWSLGESAFEAAMTHADWPARMQRLMDGDLVQRVPQAEIWLDGGHNPAAGFALAQHLGTLPVRPTYLICGMLNTKDVSGYMRPLASQALHLHAVSIPGEAATLSAEQTANAAREVGIAASTAESVGAALEVIAVDAPEARILICGSLYLAGEVLRQNRTFPT